VINDCDNVTSEPVVRWPDFKDPLENDNDPADENGNVTSKSSVEDTHFAIL
jgi:hypothetical protein